MKIILKDQTAIVLRRTPVFYEWLREADMMAGIRKEPDFKDDSGTYLVKGLTTSKELEEFLKKNYLAIFQNELREWHEEELWPQELSYEMFCKWFDVKIHRQVYEIKSEWTMDNG